MKPFAWHVVTKDKTFVTTIYDEAAVHMVSGSSVVQLYQKDDVLRAVREAMMTLPKGKVKQGAFDLELEPTRKNCLQVLEGLADQSSDTDIVTVRYERLPNGGLKAISDWAGWTPEAFERPGEAIKAISEQYRNSDGPVTDVLQYVKHLERTLRDILLVHEAGE